MQTSVGQVEFDAFNAMHGEENDSRREGLAVPYHYCEIFERSEFGPTQTETLRRESKNHSPELFPRIAQSRNDECAGDKRFA